MKNFIRADFCRIMTKKSRIILMILLATGECGFLVYQSLRDTLSATEVTMKIGNMEIIYMIVVMLINILIIYRDDLNARSMQVAIGIGIERYQIVVAKWISTVMMIILDVIFLSAVQIVTVTAMGRMAWGFAVELVVFKQVETILQTVLAITLAMLIIFPTQKAILGVLAYIYVMMGVTSGIIEIGVHNEIVQRFQLWNINAGSQVSIFINKLETGEFDIRNFTMILLYLALGIGGTIYMFRKKEIEL